MKTRAIVIGAGAAGLSAAFRLQQAGCEVRVLESSPEVGGRTRSIARNGYIMDIAAGLLPSSYTAFLRLMDDAGLKNMLEPMTSPTAVWRDGKLHYIDAANMAGSLWNTKLISFVSKLRLIPTAYTASKMWRSLDFENLGRSGPHDNANETLAAYTRRVCGNEVLEYLINPMQKLMYVMSAEKASLVDFFWSAKNLFSDKAYCVRGGMGLVASSLSLLLDVQLNTEVVAVEKSGDGVAVTSRNVDGKESIESADICVIATPANIVPRIDRGLATASKAYLENLQYSMLTDVHVQLRTRPTESAVLIMVPDCADKDLCGIVVDHNKGSDRAPAGKGAISIYLDDSWVRENWALPDSEIFRIAMSKVERVMPGVSGLVEGFHVQRWAFAATISHPGCYKQLATFVDGLDLQRRIQLAGDYFSLASVNTAVTSGELVARRLIQNYVH